MKRRSFLGLIPAGLVGALLPKVSSGREAVELPTRHAKPITALVTMAKEYDFAEATEYYTVTRRTERGSFVLDAFRLTEEAWVDHPEWCRLLVERKCREHGVNHWVSSVPQHYRPPLIDRMMVTT